jgi:hypothetical protein
MSNLVLEQSEDVPSHCQQNDYFVQPLMHLLVSSSFQA